MSDARLETNLPLPAQRPWLRGWQNRLLGSPRFQSWASRFPLTRGMAKRDGEAIFDIVAGFVHSQILMALVELGLLTLLRDRPANPAALAGRTGIAPHRLEVLLRGGVALGLLKRRRDGRFTLTRQGAALPGVPGLQAMIRHHGAFYRDLEDPVAFLRDGSETELARFWPYVFGASGEVDPEVARTYSDLMADSQGLVAEETLRHVSLRDTKCLMDVGGGSGAFLIGAMARNPAMKAVLFDLPEVMPAAEARLGRAGLSDRVRRVPGSFRDDPLPTGADTISLVRVLYDHADETVALLLRRVRMALEPGGRLIVSEPMTGGARPERPGDTYFAFYTMAMGTGRTRSAAEISRLLKDAGFRSVTPVRTRRPFVTGVVVAET